MYLIKLSSFSFPFNPSMFHVIIESLPSGHWPDSYLEYGDAECGGAC